MIIHPTAGMSETTIEIILYIRLYMIDTPPIFGLILLGAMNAGRASWNEDTEFLKGGFGGF